MNNLLPYQGEVSLSGSKSILQRIMLICSIQQTRIELSPGSLCEDVLEMAEALKTLSIMAIVTPDKIIINSECMIPLDKQTEPVCFKASATAFRFWLARTIICKCDTEIMLSEHLFNRPWQLFAETLKSFGCSVSITDNIDKDYPHHITISQATKAPDDICVDGSVSSQFISGLMLVAPLLPEGLHLRFEQLPVSFEYLKLTGYLLDSFGINCKIEAKEIHIAAGSVYHFPDNYHIESDMSSAAFFLALGAFSENGIKLETGISTRWQPDWAVIDMIEGMGVSIIDTGESITSIRNTLQGVCLNMQDNPDLFPVLAILALFADSASTFNNIARLKHKESDRVSGILEALDLIGAEYDFDHDCLKVFPLKQAPESVTLNTNGDHRLMMAFTLIQLHFPQVLLSESRSVLKSCPEFFSELAQLKK